MLFVLLASLTFAQDSLNTLSETYSIPAKDLYIYKWSKRRAVEDYCRDQMSPKVPAGSSIWTVIGTTKEQGNTVTVACTVTTLTQAQGNVLLAYERSLDFRPWKTSGGNTVWTRFERLPQAPYFEVRFEERLSTTDGPVSVSSAIKFENDSHKATITLVPHTRDLAEGVFAKAADGTPTTLEVSIGESVALSHSKLGVLTARDSTITFPENFLFGVATAAHQMEGYTQNSQWYAFETKDKTLFPKLEKPEPIFGGGTSNEVDGPNHWDHMEEDLQRVVDLKVGSYRFSIAWDKLNPKAIDLAAYEKDCQFEKGAAEKYRMLLKFLDDKKIVPVMTLYHFALPRWIAEKGGWDNKDTAKFFARFAECTAKEIAPNVEYFVTLNEPYNHVMGGYQSDDCPPAKKEATGFSGLAKAIANELSAHFLAYDRIKKVNPKARVGIAHRHDTWMTGGSLKSFVGQNWNWTVPDAMQTGEVVVNAPVAFLTGKAKVPNFAKGKQDFYGFNYYTRLYPHYEGSPMSARRVSDMGWETYPEGIYDMLKTVAAKNQGLPILVLENGTGDRNDIDRQRYVQQYLQAVREAITDGVPVQGYFYWTLLDNFEWDAGYAPRFGFYSVDRKTKARTLRSSGEWYKNVCEKRGFELKQ